MASPATQAPMPSVPSSAPTPAAPPSRSEIERKLSFRSATSPRIDQSPRKQRSTSAMSGNDSDTSQSSVQGHSQSASVASPLLSPSLPSASGQGPLPGQTPTATRQLSAIAEKLSRGGAVEEVEEYEEHDEGEDVSDEEDVGDAEEKKGQGELERGMEGERVLRSGYLYKKQEKRKVWKKKWFVLRTGKLAYYKDDREYSLSRVIDLRIIHTAAPVKVKKHSFTFGIVTKKRTFLVEASSQNEMDEWVSAIGTARRKLTEEGEKRQGGPSGSRTGTATPMEGAVGSGMSAINTNPSYLSRLGGTPVHSSPAQMHPTTGLPSTPAAMTSPGSPEVSAQSGLTSQMARMGVQSPSQPVGSGIQRQPSNAAQPTRITSASRREPSASSISSSGVDYFPRTPSAGYLSGGNVLSPQSAAHPGFTGVSSDSEDLEAETYFSDIALVGQSQSQSQGQSQFGASVGTTKSMMSSVGPGQVDPARVILSAYLMKRSKGRGRKVWRKRWFFLTSQGITYTKSHMDTKPIRSIPLSSILDAIDQSSTLDDVDPSSSDSDGPSGVVGTISRPTRSPSTSKLPSPPQRQLSSLIHPGSSSNPSSSTPGDGEHTFRLVTAKRNYVLCAPSEEDEIKWLAAVKALLNRERGMGSPVNEMAPRFGSAPGRSTSQGASVPTITQQPPTPNSINSGTGTVGLAPPIPVDQTFSQGQGLTYDNSGNVQPVHPGGIGLRGRSATYLAKSAVADVEKRFHPER